MNKKALLLLASAVLSLGAITEGEAGILPRSDSAIIDSLVPNPDYTQFTLERDLFDNPNQYIKQRQLFEYFEQRFQFDEADKVFMTVLTQTMYTPEYKESVKSGASDFLTYLKKMVYSDPYRSRNYYLLGVFYQYTGKYTDAQIAFQKAIDIDKTNVLYMVKLAQVYEALGRYDKAIILYEFVLRAYPRSTDCRIALARCYTQNGKYDEAVTQYRVASSLDPTNNDTVVAIAELSAYSKTAKQNTFYDPMFGARPAAMPSAQKLVAFSAETPSSAYKTVQSNASPIKPVGQRVMITSTVASSPTSSAATTVKTLRPQTVAAAPVNPSADPASMPTSASDSHPLPQVQTDPAAMPVVQTTSSVQAAPAHAQTQAVYQRPAGAKSVQQQVRKPVSHSTRRVMVSYVNGRKVVKIVNINQNTNTDEALSNASKTFARQIDENNTAGTENVQSSGYAFADASSAPSGQTFSEKTSVTGNSTYGNTTSASANDSYSKTSKYSQLDKRDYVTGERPAKASDSDGLNVSDLTKSNDPARKQMLLTQKQGIKSVKAPKELVASEQKGDNDKKGLFSKTKKIKESKVNANLKTTTSEENSDIYIKSNELIAQNQYAEAIDVLNTVNPATLRSLTSIASCYNSLGEKDSAIEYYDKANALSPDNSQILYSLGYLYYSKNDIEKAKSYINASLKLDPENVNAKELNNYMSQQDSNVLMTQAVKFMNDGNFVDSKTLLDKIVISDPSDFQAYYYLGHVGYATHKYEESVKNFNLAIKYNPSYALSYYSVGLSYDKMRNSADALASYQKFVDLVKDDNKYTRYAKSRIATIKKTK